MEETIGLKLNAPNFNVVASKQSKATLCATTGFTDTQLTNYAVATQLRFYLEVYFVNTKPPLKEWNGATGLGSLISLSPPV